ncbi:MAG: MFS transporter [Halieaceae bacterium]|jgi:MFS transporter, ACS family, glucarate transporter|nr:MFS transporter [Halieaceae bacterium]
MTNENPTQPSTARWRILNPTQPSSVRWRILGLLMFLSFVSYLLRGNMSIAAPTMMADLQLSEVQWGMIMAAFPLGYALFQFPGGLLGDRFGPRKVLTWIAAAWAVLIVLSSMVPGAAVASAGLIVISLMLVQFLVGATHAPVFPVMSATIERWFPVGSWAFPNGLSSTGLTLGLAGTASLLPWLMGMVGWRMSFVVLAPVGLIGAALWWWYAKDNPSEHPAVNSAEVELINDGRVELEEKKPATSETPAWLRVLKDRNALLLTLSYSCMNFVFYVVFSWGFYYLVKIRGFDAQEAGFLTSAQWMFAGAGAALGGWYGDFLCQKLGLRWGYRLPIVIGLVISALLLIGVAVTPNAYAAAAMLGLCFFFNQTTEGSYWGSSIAIGGRHAGASGGLLNTGANAMGFINALLLSLVADTFGWATAIAIGAGFALLGAIFALMVRCDEPVNQAD